MKKINKLAAVLGLIFTANLLSACSSNTPAETVTTEIITEQTITTTTLAVTEQELKVTTTQTAKETTAKTEKETPEEDSVLYKNDFEKDLGGWELRGGSTGTVELEKGALKMSGRTQNWHGTSMNGNIFVGGESYTLTAKVMQDTGKTQNIGCKFQYNDADGSAHYDGIASVDAPSGEWVEIIGTTTLTAEETFGLTIYFEMGQGDFTEGSFYIDDIIIEGVKAVIAEPGDIMEFYDEMISDSLISTGNNTRIKNVIEKAKKGEEVTLAYIGGSITEGANASPNSNCYAAASAKAFADTYGNGKNVKCINAGMSGTPSCLGVIRYERDVLDVGTPDAVFIEFAVNDGDDITGGDAYESMVRDILNAENKPAVVLIFSVFKNGLWNMQSTYIPVGEYYDLPMISIRNAIAPKINNGQMTNEQFFAADGLHPTNDGHAIMKDCIMNMFKRVDEETKAKEDIKIPEKAKLGKSYEGIKTIDSLTDMNISVGGFDSTDKNTGTFHFNGKAKLPNNWKHTATSGNDPFTMKITSKNLLLVYKFSNSKTAGKADVYVDGKLVKTLNSYKNDGWNNATTAIVFNEDSAKEHIVEVKMADGDEEKEFTILAFGSTN